MKSRRELDAFLPSDTLATADPLALCEALQPRASLTVTGPEFAEITRHLCVARARLAPGARVAFMFQLTMAELNALWAQPLTPALAVKVGSLMRGLRQIADASPAMDEALVRAIIEAAKGSAE